MVKSVLILNGPNLNLLGKREPEIYGREGLDAIQKLCEQSAIELGLELCFEQSNHEGALIDHLHESDTTKNGCIFNPAGFSHSSVAIADAVAALSIPVIEVHISNIFARESFRHHSYISAHCQGSITGFGIYGYKMALHALADQHLHNEAKTGL